jgi:hypothetical protein
VLQGRPDDAMARLREALAGYEATGAAVARPGVFALLAYATAMTGRVDEGLEHVADGMDDAERTSQRFHLIQLNLARGDLLLLGSGPAARAAEAETCYRRALDLARAFGAPMLELRAATSLARLWFTAGPKRRRRRAACAAGRGVQRRPRPARSAGRADPAGAVVSTTRATEVGDLRYRSGRIEDVVKRPTERTPWNASAPRSSALSANGAAGRRVARPLPCCITAIDSTSFRDSGQTGRRVTRRPGRAP